MVPEGTSQADTMVTPVGNATAGKAAMSQASGRHPQYGHAQLLLATREVAPAGPARDDDHLAAGGGERLGEVGEQLRRGGFIRPVEAVEEDNARHWG